VSEADQRSGLSGRVYTLDPEPIARGGQGTVWGALRDDGLAVAIKVADDTAVSRDALEGEANLLEWVAERRVPGVAELLDRLDWDGRPALVMPRYPMDANGHVHALIQGAQGDAIEAVLGFGIALARVLSALHRTEIPLEDGRQGVLVHRDIKPENILVDSEGGVRLVDLGGTLVVDAFQAVRLAVFGSPLWAPYDQILPGLPEPNPTWDTYAASVVLFWWITGTRPAYQANPTPILTERGIQIWEAFSRVARAPQEDRERLIALHRELTAAREGTREADLVQVRGHAAIQPEDLSAIDEGLARLASAERYGEEALELCARDLAVMFGRALSPLSHPSPPNRYWDALGLADELDAVRRRLVQAREARVAAQDRDGMAARLAGLGTRVLPATAVPIGADATSEEEGLDPLPREVRPPKASPRALPKSSFPWGWVLGVLAGVGLFGLMSIPLALRLLTLSGGEPILPEHPTLSLDSGPALIEAGGFTMGDVWGAGEDNERPTRIVTLPRYWMDRTEVSNHDYAGCVAAGACAALSDLEAALDDGKGRDIPLSLRAEDHPVVGVDQAAASAYCAWRQGRLPTEEEWEKAATWGPDAKADTDKRRWPWGDDPPDCTRVNAAGCGRSTTLSVGALAGGMSAYGVKNLAGNVWEWTSTATTVRAARKPLIGRAKPAISHYYVRGGAYDTVEASLRPTYRRHLSPDTVDANLGFRCVYDQG